LGDCEVKVGVDFPQMTTPVPPEDIALPSSSKGFLPEKGLGKAPTSVIDSTSRLDTESVGLSLVIGSPLQKSLVRGCCKQGQ
jgi:hypothetical protein